MQLFVIVVFLVSPVSSGISPRLKITPIITVLIAETLVLCLLLFGWRDDKIMWLFDLLNGGRRNHKFFLYVLTDTETVNFSLFEVEIFLFIFKCFYDLNFAKFFYFTVSFFDFRKEIWKFLVLKILLMFFIDKNDLFLKKCGCSPGRISGLVFKTT